VVTGEDRDLVIGRTWTQIAAVLGVSKQAARERFGDPSLR